MAPDDELLVVTGNLTAAEGSGSRRWTAAFTRYRIPMKQAETGGAEVARSWPGNEPDCTDG